jgi:predicted RNA binding protein YcfA (HicA-like mRNA interferase family)
MKVHEILSLLEEDGWEVVTTRGSHQQQAPDEERPRDSRRQALR